MSRNRLAPAVASIALVGGLLGQVPPASAAFEGTVASAVLQTSDGAGTLTPIGAVSFQQENGKVVIRVDIRPNTTLTAGFHGMHVHDVGICAGPAFTSAGGHYNPSATAHGAHAGDLPVLLVQADGSARAIDETSAFTVSELRAADVAVIVHAGVDNYSNIPALRLTDAVGTVTQQAYYYDSNGDGVPDSAGPDPATTAKTGDSGARAACGVVGPAAATFAGGYWMVATDGGVFTEGAAPFLGSEGGRRLNGPVVGMAATSSGAGYWLAASDGGVFPHGDASFEGSMGGTKLNSPVVGMAAEPAHARAVLADSTGARVGVVTFAQKGDGVHVHVNAKGITPGFHGFHIHDVGTCTAPAFTSAGGHYNPGSLAHGAHAGDNPVLLARGDGIVDETFVTNNYTVTQLLGADVAAVIHANTDNYANIPATYRYDADNNGPDAADPAGPDPGTTGKTGDAGARRICGPVRATGGSSKAGYWLVASDGGVFTFGDAGFFGSASGLKLSRPVVGIAPTPTGDGYWLVGSDGGVFNYGDARFFGSLGGINLNLPIVGIATTPSGNGYWLFASDGGVFAFGDASYEGSTGGRNLNSPVVGAAVTESGHGYDLYAADGGVFNFGDATFHGSEGGRTLNQPVLGGARAAG
ncbi:MAG: superoxide dismutase family protein [Acidimicrobiales bacterium]